MGPFILRSVVNPNLLIVKCWHGYFASELSVRDQRFLNEEYLIDQSNY